MCNTFDNFLSRLRTRESGISTKLANWYEINFGLPVIDYPKITETGKVEREWSSGRPIYEKTTVCEYFRKLGVLDLYLSGEAERLKKMQYASVNPWGFVGYQFGEAILRENGYYKPRKIAIESTSGLSHIEVYCGESNDATQWSHGKKEKLISRNCQKEAIFTDVNRWEGKFTGKHSLNTFADLKKENVQETVIREVISSNLYLVKNALKAHGTSIAQVTNKVMDERAKCRTDTGQTNLITLSGIAASCHLCGWRATVEYLITAKSATDEIGTSAESYMSAFGGYEIPASLLTE